MRAVIFCDYPYRREGGIVTAEQPVALFLGAVAGCLEEAAFMGRLDPKPGSYPYALPASARFVELPWYARLTPRSAGRFLAALRRFWGELDHADVVWLLGPHPLAVLFALAALARRRRVVLGVRQHLPDYLSRRHPGSRTARVAGAVLEWMWRRLARRCPVVAVGPQLSAGYAHAPELLDSAFSLLGEPAATAVRDWDGSLVALSVGRLDPEKNPLLLADVLAALPSRWRLVVCGDGSLEDELGRRLAARGLAGRAELRGHVPAGAPLAAVQREAHAFLHVSWTEGFPQVLLEAWAAALPVVATAVGGVPAVAEGAALLVEPGDAPAAAAALETLAADPALRERLVGAGLERVAGRTMVAEAARVATFLTGSETVEAA